VIPAVDNLLTSYQDSMVDATSLSQMTVIIKSWKSKDLLKQLKILLASFSTGFEIHDDLMEVVVNLEEATNCIFQICDRIKDYEVHKQMADYYANIAAACYNETIPDIMELEVIVKSNLILESYNKALQGFKQWIFPFIKLYLPTLTLSKNYLLSDLISNALRNIDGITDATNEHDSSIIRQHDQYTHKCEFDEDNNPLVVWKFDENQQEIQRLLKGNEVALLADIQAGLDFDAIKFSRIELKFRAKSESVQQQIDKRLSQCIIKMTHSGDSYYRCQNQVYIIATEPQVISYNVQRTNKNVICEKLEKHEPVLSPYTTWKFKIQPALFDECFVEEVDLWFWTVFGQ
jgi:hypothetical protein